LHAIALLGMTNSRLKDYLDLSVLLEREALDESVLATAIAATFARRGMVVPTSVPIGLTNEFATDPSRQAIWRAFLKKNEMAQAPLIGAVRTIRAVLEPVVLNAATLTGTAYASKKGAEFAHLERDLNNPRKGYRDF
jgi:hypothetical protein